MGAIGATIVVCDWSSSDLEWGSRRERAELPRLQMGGAEFLFDGMVRIFLE